MLPRVNLGELYQHFTGDKLKGAHDALADCKATQLVLEKLWDGKKPLDYVPLQSQETLMEKKRLEKGLVTRVKLFNTKKNTSKEATHPKSLRIDKKTIVKCDYCGRVRSTYFAQCTHML